MLFFSATSVTATEAVRIAIALPLSGPQQNIGRDVKIAVELALSENRAKSGSATREFELSWFDDLCSSDGGAAVAKRIVADPQQLPFAIVGHACPSAAQAAGPIYNAAGVLFVNAGLLPGRVPATGRFGPRHLLLPGDGAHESLIGKALLDAGPAARIAFIRDRTKLSQAALQPVAAALAAAGRSALLVETFAGAEKDFTGLAQRIRAAEITHVALAAFPSEAVLLLQEVRKANPALTIFATDQLADPEFARLSSSSADGVFVAKAPEYRDFASAAKLVSQIETNGAVPSRAALASFAAIEIVIALADRPQSDTVISPRETPGAGAINTFLGPIQFDVKGNANLPEHVFYAWHKGQLLPVAP